MDGPCHFGALKLASKQALGDLNAQILFDSARLSYTKVTDCQSPFGLFLPADLTFLPATSWHQSPGPLPKIHST